MQEEQKIELKELERLFVVCPSANCGAEIGFDFGKPVLAITGAASFTCPNCRQEIFQSCRYEPFIGTWLTFFKKFLEHSKESKVQVFFRVQGKVQKEFLGKAGEAVMMARCKCGAECSHHKPGECPNPMVAPVQVITDPATNKPASNSELGMCQACWDNYAAEDETVV